MMHLSRGEYLRDRWLKFRNQLLTNSQFQRWAATSVFTKPIASRKARALFDICAGFVHSQILYACIQLQVFELLSDGPRTLEDIAQHTELSNEAANQLLTAATSLKLIEQTREKKFCLGELGAALLGNPGIDAMVRHHSHFYADLVDPINLLKGKVARTNLAEFWGYAQSSEPQNLSTHQVAAYTQLMAQSMQLLARDILDSYSFEQHKVLMDVGGGNGTFLVNVCRRWRHLQAKLVDLPAVVETAKTLVAEQELSQQITVAGKDIFAQALPTGADAISLVRILHDHNDEAVKILLKRVFEALAPKGRVIVAEPMAGASGAQHVGDAYFNFYLLAMGSGKPRSPQELMSLLEAAGFTGCRQITTPRSLITQLIVGEKA